MKITLKLKQIHLALFNVILSRQLLTSSWHKKTKKEIKREALTTAVISAPVSQNDSDQ